ncbi:MAG: 4-(cytidine 5'-diphospho)-2-C-methyl-D-erythritol kinase [Clostridia bacterium]|nr:4-(cytidine 5'-diphospho)-2-C-methyl-D-erythritol kinase [Clostridia bacterium]
MLLTKFRAYGKINLYLSVGEKRDDGFHSVETVMHKAPLYDDIIIEKVEARGIELICSAGSDSSELPLPLDGTNLIYRAVEKLHEAIGCPIGSLDYGYRITVEKRIPIAGGMGGGSADAGYTLRHLNIALGEPLTVDELSGIAASLGSDVPFFVYGEDAMIATGRGEIMEKCPSLPPCRMLFRGCGKKPSTGAMYARLDAMRESSKVGSEASFPTLSDMIESLKRGNLQEICGNIHNSFTDVFMELAASSRALELATSSKTLELATSSNTPELATSSRALLLSEDNSPTLTEVLEDFKRDGAIAAFLCGSGPTVCGIYPIQKNDN